MLKSSLLLLLLHGLLFYNVNMTRIAVESKIDIRPNETQ